MVSTISCPKFDPIVKGCRLYGYVSHHPRVKRILAVCNRNFLVDKRKSVSFQAVGDNAFSANTCAKQLNISPNITDQGLFVAGLTAVLPMIDTNFTMP